MKVSPIMCSSSTRIESYILSCLLFHVALISSIASVDNFLDKLKPLTTIVDYRIHPPYRYRNHNYHVGNMTNIHKLDIEFYHEISNLDNQSSAVRTNHIPLLFLESTNTQIAIHINGQHDFGVTSRCIGCNDINIYDFTNQSNTVRAGKRLLHTSTRYFPKHAAKPFIGKSSGYTRYHLQIIDQQSIHANINGCAVQSSLKHEIFPKDDLFKIRIDGPEFPEDGFIKNLYIRASTKQFRESAKSKVNARNSYGRWLYFKQMEKL